MLSAIQAKSSKSVALLHDQPICRADHKGNERQKSQEIKDDVGLQFQAISTGTDVGQAMAQQRNTNKGGSDQAYLAKGLWGGKGLWKGRDSRDDGCSGKMDSGQEWGWESLAMASREQEGWPGKYK